MSAPARVRVGAAVLFPDALALRGPRGGGRLVPKTARLIARLAAADGALVPWHALTDALYAPGEEPPDDGGRGVLAVAAVRARKALRDADAGVGIATVKGGPCATGREGGMRLDPEAAGRALVHQRRDYRRFLDAHADGVPHAELAERFGLKNADCVKTLVWRLKHRMREAATARDAGAVP